MEYAASAAGFYDVEHVDPVRKLFQKAVAEERVADAEWKFLLKAEGRKFFSGFRRTNPVFEVGEVVVQCRKIK